MLPLTMALSSYVRALRGTGDRGEVGPIGYTVMVSAIVVLALAVLVWGEGVAQMFMTNLDGEIGNGGGEP